MEEKGESSGSHSDAAWREKLSRQLGSHGNRRRVQTQRILLGFYGAHAISVFSFRLWAFAVPVVLISLYPHDMFPPSAYLVVDYTLKVFALPAVVSKACSSTLNRLDIMRLLCFSQAALGCLSAIGLLVLQRYQAVPPQPQHAYRRHYSVGEVLIATFSLVAGSAGNWIDSYARILVAPEKVMLISPPFSIHACRRRGMFSFDYFAREGLDPEHGCRR
jgi:hypothetical protein